MNDRLTLEDIRELGEDLVNAYNSPDSFLVLIDESTGIKVRSQMNAKVMISFIVRLKITHPLEWEFAQTLVHHLQDAKKKEEENKNE